MFNPTYTTQYLARMPQDRPLAEHLLGSFQAYAKTQQFDLSPESLYAPIRYALATEGKAVRPMLLLLTHALGEPRVDAALPAAYALELFHNFTLVHDDIMDRASLRRGRPCVHVKYGEPTAILAGDAMLIHTYGYLLDHYQGELGRRILAHFQRMAVALCGGQQRDMDMEVAEVATFDAYLQMIHGKTGVLITAAMTIGAELAGLSEVDIARIGQAGDLAGRAFQIQDDLLDTFRTSEVTGKMNYGDIVRGKLSAPYLKALTLANPQQADWLANIYAGGETVRQARVQEVLSLFETLGVENQLAASVHESSQAALNLLDQVGGSDAARAALKSFVSRLATRAF